MCVLLLLSLSWPHGTTTPRSPYRHERRSRGGPPSESAKGPCLGLGLCFRDHLQREPTLNPCKRCGRTTIAKPHGDHKAHGGCCLMWGMEPTLSLADVGLRSWAVFPTQQKPSPGGFLLVTVPTTR